MIILYIAIGIAAVIGLGKFLKALDEDNRRHTKDFFEFGCHREFGDTPAAAHNNVHPIRTVSFRDGGAL